MMAYYSQHQLEEMRFKFLGDNVLISDKAAIYNAEEIEIGDNSRIDDFCIVSGRVKIGRYCHITPTCLIAGGDPGVFLSDFCTLAYGVKVFAQSDDYSGETMTNSLIPAEYKAEQFSSVYLEKFVIIGAGSIVLPGANLSEGCSIGAMSLVSKPLDAWGIYAGIPVKRIKDRKKNLLELSEKFTGEEK